LLTAKYNEGAPKDTRISLPEYSWLKNEFEGDAARRRLAKVKQLAEVARDLGAPMATMALAWCLKNPRVSSVITGASKPAQIKENMKAGELVPKMLPAIMERIDRILTS
jgi:aryl-alcohol dehydrogenase-like predicted oxidoreductase